MSKFLQCQICQFNARSQYLVYTIHPNRLQDDRCLDFQANPATEQKSCALEGYAWYSGELIKQTRTLTEDDRLNLLETHPLSTGHCPRFNREYEETPIEHWDLLGVVGGMTRFEERRSLYGDAMDDTTSIFGIMTADASA